MVGGLAGGLWMRNWASGPLVRAATASEALLADLEAFAPYPKATGTTPEQFRVTARA